TQIAAGRSSGKRSVIARSALTPPADAPIATMRSSDMTARHARILAALRLGGDEHRQRAGECRALARSVAGGADAAAVHLHDVVHDRQTEPESAERTQAGALRLAK